MTISIPAPKMDDVCLDIRDLRTYFHVREGIAKAVDGVSLQLMRGETLGLAGESGCGKTVTALSILKLLDIPPGEYRGGRIIFEGRDLLKASEKEMQEVRGKRISLIFQEPMTSLNPIMSIGFQIEEALLNHKEMCRVEKRQRAIELLSMVGIPDPRRRIGEYPHQLSGGMRQRVMIAMALACNPKVLIADEPTTALDVTIQAQIMELMAGLQEDLGTSILLITHDLAVIAETAHRVAIMYGGKIVEEADVSTIFKNPLHPYTQGLMKSVPRIDKSSNSRRLEEIPGLVPNLYNLPEGCSFYDRCLLAKEKCRTVIPQLLAVDAGHKVRCWIAQGG